MLVFQIQRKLLTLSQLRLVVRSLESDHENADDLSEPELCNQIINYIRGEGLKATEDKGMPQLITLHDKLHDLISDQGSIEGGSSALHHGEGIQTHLRASNKDIHTPPPDMDTHTLSSHRDIHTHHSVIDIQPSGMDGDTHTSNRNMTTGRPAQSSAISTFSAYHGRPSLSSTITDLVVRLTDVTALLQR